MNNNDIIRRLRYIFDFGDSEMMEIFRVGGRPASRAKISDWLKRDGDDAQQELYDDQLVVFLNGLIDEKRGKREGTQHKPERYLNNNIILRKLKIALSLKDTDMLAILELADFPISKHELSAFFRKPGQNQYRLCKDQILRNFLQGLQIKYRES